MFSIFTKVKPSNLNSKNKEAVGVALSFGDQVKHVYLCWLHGRQTKS
jgi:hypothetical protein